MTQARTELRPVDPVDLGLRVVAAALTLTAAYVHSTLGGLLFTMNALGYATLAVTIIVPFALADRYRILARLALLGFTAMTLTGWLLIGARYDVAYLTAAIEVALILVLIADTYRVDGGPVSIARRLLGMAADVVALVSGRGPRYAGA